MPQSPDRVNIHPDVLPTEALAEGKEWWFRTPTLIRKRNPEIIGGVDPSLQPALHFLSQLISTGLEWEFRRNGCPVMVWDGNPISKTPEQAVIINPVFLAIPATAQAAFGYADFDKFKANLRQYLPEVNLEEGVYPYAVSIGRSQMELEPPLHPNFVNMILVDDTSSDIRTLPYERKLILIRMLLGKLGAFKTVIIPFERREDDSLFFDHFILGTMEGGQPDIRTIGELARRLMVFGSTKEVGGFKGFPELAIRPEDWKSSVVVNGLIELGHFLGDHHLLSDPIAIKELVRDERLARIIEGLLNYTRQAEGAFWAIDPKINYHFEDLRWEASKTVALPLVTASGKYDVTKTALGYEDIVAVVPTREGIVWVIPVGDREPKGPSVEAEEFTLPLLDLPTFKLAEVEGGYRIVPTIAEGIGVPGIRAGIHIHRGYVKPRSDKVIEVPTNISKFPPVGCGVDLMHKMSQDAMQRALELWEAGRRKALCALFYVPNHGTNIFVFWKPDENGVIPLDPFAQIKKLVEEEELEFVPEVPQV